MGSRVRVPYAPQNRISLLIRFFCFYTPHDALKKINSPNRSSLSLHLQNHFHSFSFSELPFIKRTTLSIRHKPTSRRAAVFLYRHPSSSYTYTRKIQHSHTINMLFSYRKQLSLFIFILFNQYPNIYKFIKKQAYNYNLKRNKANNITYCCF